MKRITYLIVAAALIFSSCEDFLNTEPLTQKTGANFPQTANDAKQMMAGIYTTLQNEQTNCDASSLFVFEVASDEKIGGGGKNDIKAQSYESFMYSDDDMLRHTWEVSYEGIHRANFALENLDLLAESVVSASLKDQYRGEALFLRALIYYRLATLFGDVPLKVTTTPADLGAASANDIFAQIATDLKSAIELLPEVPYSSTEQGRVTRWAAQAMMARVYLFYTGFYQQTSLPLIGGSVTKAEVTTWLGDCIDESGHYLVGDYHELWPYTNKYTIGDYDYIQDYMTAKGKNLVFACDDGARNPETVFAVQFNNFAQWDARRGYSNQYQLYFGLRGMQNINNTVPFSGGWGQGNSIPKSLVDQWEIDEPGDIRLGASIIHIPTELPNYNYGVWDFVLESDYWGKKYIGATAINPVDGLRKHDYSSIMYGNQNQDQLGHADDLVLIRFADVLLMMSELTEDASYMNEVRERVDLDPVAYSLENIQKERSHELAFEGLRWNDMRRWGAVYAKAALEKQIGVPVYNVSVPGTFKNLNPNKSYSVRYDETKGFFPIPLSQIKLSNGLLEQVEGYTNADFYPGFSQ